MRTLAVSLVALTVVALSCGTASAQRYPMTVNQQSAANLYRSSVNPNYYIAPGMTLNQYAYNTATMGRAYSYVPPYAMGYNPYPRVVNYGPSFPTITSGYNPYGTYGLPSYSGYPAYNLYGNYP